MSIVSDILGFGWLKVALYAGLSAGLLGTGFKIGSWKEASTMTSDLEAARTATSECEAQKTKALQDYALSAKTALELAESAAQEKIDAAAIQAQHDSDVLQGQVKELQASAKARVAFDQRIAAVSGGGCTLAPGIVGVLNDASRRANDHASGPAKAAAAKPSSVPDSSAKPRDDESHGAAAGHRIPVDPSG